MSVTYEYEGKNIEVSEVKDCIMNVSLDGFTATIGIKESTGKFVVNAKDGIIGSIHDNEEGALKSACRRILTQQDATSKKELCSRLEKSL